MPIKVFQLNDVYGNRVHPISKARNTFHSGIDIKAGFDTVYAILPGIIITASYGPIIGNYLVISHGRFQSIYGHLSIRYYNPGSLIGGGQPIGLSGRTGRVTGPHLHFSVKRKGRFINPLYFLRLLSLMDGNEIIDYLKF